MRARRALLGAAVVLGALVGIGPAAALAHPLLIAATPQPGLVATGSPSAITLTLSEPAVARGSRIRVYGPSGRELAVTPVRAADGRRTLSVRPRTALRSAVYTVRWGALGDDGHIVTGRFGFGVAGAKGAAPPGVERLAGSGGGRGGEDAAADGVAKVLGRWLGVLSASLLFGGFVLVELLRRRRGAGAEVAALRRVAAVAWLLVVLAAVEGVLAGATAGTGDGLDLGLLTASASGVSDLVRGVLVLVLSIALALTAGRPALRDRLYLGGGAAVLLTYALSGHALSFPTFWALLDQGVHVLAAGLWLGGILALALLTLRGTLPLAEGVRAFAPAAATALGVAILTGVLAAVREVDRWYFLRWSDYGRIVIVKALLVGIVALGAAVAWSRWRRAEAGDAHAGMGAAHAGEAHAGEAHAGAHAGGAAAGGAAADDGGRRGSRLLRAEAAGVVAILVLAVALSSLAQGRGQPLPAQRGTLFAGPAFGTAVLPEANAAVGLAPARAGSNVLTVGIAPGQPMPRRVTARLVCSACGVKPVRAALRPRGGRTWSAGMQIEADGTWFAYVTIDAVTAPPVALAVGVPRAPGAPAVSVLAVADLSGPYAERCRAHVIGLELAIAQLNADGGVDGGRKVAPLVLDSGGTAAGAASAARRGLQSNPIAMAGACGTGAVAAVEAASRAGIPSVVGDPAVDPTSADRVFRLAADPYAQGLAFGQLVRNRILASGEPGVRTVRAVAGDDLQARRLLAGLRAGLRASAAARGAPATPGPEPRLVRIAPGSLAKLSQDELARVLDRRLTTALVLDAPGGGGADARAIARLGVARGAGLAPAPLLLSERVLSEPYVLSAGALGRLGAIQGVSEVATNTADAGLYRSAVPLLFRGDIASLDGLRGYATGLALRDALRSGTSAAAIVANLRDPRVFTNALLAPWSPREPGAGSPNVVALQPQFLSPTLVPGSIGGEAKDTEYFPQGGWTVTSGVPLGVTPALRQPPVE